MENNIGDMIGGVALLCLVFIPAFVGAMAWAGTTKTIASSGKSYCKILTIEVNK